MTVPIGQHQAEIGQNLEAWNGKPLLRKVYAMLYDRIAQHVRPELPGRILEIGSGIGNLKGRFPTAIASDLFPNHWLDLTCDGYELPFSNSTLSHLILFDVFHHLEAPVAFLSEARRVLIPGGRVLIMDPYISLLSYPAYEWFHHEKSGCGKGIRFDAKPPRPRDYYTAQANATRLFFKNEFPDWIKGWQVRHAEAFACFHYLGSGGFSHRAWYPAGLVNTLAGLDRLLSHLPGCFAGRCLVILEPSPAH